MVGSYGMRDEQVAKQLLFGNLCILRSSSDHGPGRPHKSWQDCVREDLTALRRQHNWSEVAHDQDCGTSMIETN